MYFNRIIFWCEFPKEVNWQKFNKILNFPIEIYIASNTKKEFLKWKSKIKNKNVKEIGVWPTLSLEQGYWFSSYLSKENINKLKEFEKINMKIDLEPPLLTKSYNFFKLARIYTKFILFKRSKNKTYLNQTINEISKSNKIILSGFPFPKFLSSFYGDVHLDGKNIYRNFFIYSTLIPKPLRAISRLYFKYFIKKSLKKFTEEKTLFAVGCIGHGILGNEPKYNNINELDKDLKFLLKNKVKNVVIFDLAGTMNRDKPQEWLNTIKKYQNQ
ncbi:MAG TPA: hypothetical protein VJI68_00180 [Candidatus Nanoarchaeia archaeon]|nr:hypothetical protein [Candidatus Nanoarchaeia archaeon]